MAPSASSSTRPRPDQKSKKRRGLASSPIVDSIKPKTKRTRLTVDTLRWQPVKATGFSGMDEGGGMMMLEELDDVLVEWDEDESGRKVARFVDVEGKAKAAEPSKGKQRSNVFEEVLVESKQNHDLPVQEEDNVEAGELPSFSQMAEADLNAADDEQKDDLGRPFDDKLIPEWASIPLHPALKRALLALGFMKPTEVQERSLQHGLGGRDVVGVAETGSGKTLAYSLPILSHLLSSPSPALSARRDLTALILCPTRELALQVVDHINLILRHALDEQTGTPGISVGSVVGGLSAQKQKRIVERGCDILVATPGRLWDLIKTDEELAAGIRSLRFMVIDEADRMIENGHFAELENIVGLTQRDADQVQGPDDQDPVFAATSSRLTDSPARDDMQTFVFSATLSKDLQQNLKRRNRSSTSKKRPTKQASALEDLVDRLDFRDPKPELIDLSPEGGVVAMLKESMVECVVSDKDLYLYYFLLRYPGRTLVFVGSIDGIRRLIPLFEVLQLPVYPLHSQLQQKQRLKNLDRFKSSSNGVLIATDVASRGLDIPQVDHVVHFNLPRTADSYIHRSGRTARAQNPGFALQLCAPEERGMQRALMMSLGRDRELPDLSIESGFLPKLRERIRLARDIEKAQHNVKKENHDRNWLKEAAEAMEVDIDPSMLSGEDSDLDVPFQRRKKSKSGKVKNLKAELRERLAEPLVARGVSTRYPTSGSKVIIDDIIKSTSHPTMLGASTIKAYDEMQPARGKTNFGKRKRPVQT